MRVVFLYLAEAHAADSWPLSGCARSVHRSLEERLKAAQGFLDEHPGLASVVDDVYVDDMDENTTVANGLWPERYLLLNGAMVQWASSLRFEDRCVDVPKLICDAAASFF